MQFKGLAVNILLRPRFRGDRLASAQAGGKVVNMGQQSRNSREDKDSTIRKDPPQGESKDIDDFVNSLSDEHKMLVVLKKQLYDGIWEPMLDDLQHRLAGKPYIFKLVNRIEDDTKRIEQMQKFEIEHNIDLADYVNMP